MRTKPTGGDPAAGLPEIAKEAPSAAAREIAEVAHALGWTLGALARQLNDDGGARVAANVSRLLYAQRPREETIRRLAEIVGIDDEHLQLAVGDRLNPERLAWWRQRMLRFLDLNGPRFKADTARRVDQFLAEDDDHTCRVIQVFAYVSHREDLGVYGEGEDLVVQIGPSWYGPRNVLAAVRLLKGYGLDLQPYRRNPSPSEAALSNIALALHPLVSEHERDSVLTVARAMLATHGHDVAAMDQHLGRTIAQIAKERS